MTAVLDFAFEQAYNDECRLGTVPLAGTNPHPWTQHGSKSASILQAGTFQDKPMGSVMLAGTHLSAGRSVTGTVENLDPVVNSRTWSGHCRALTTRANATIRKDCKMPRMCPLVISVGRGATAF